MYIATPVRLLIYQVYWNDPLTRSDEDLTKWAWFWEALASLSWFPCAFTIRMVSYISSQESKLGTSRKLKLLALHNNLRRPYMLTIPMFPLFLGWSPQSTQWWANTWSISSSHIPFTNNQSGPPTMPQLYWTKCQNTSYNILSHHYYKLFHPNGQTEAT